MLYVPTEIYNIIQSSTAGTLLLHSYALYNKQCHGSHIFVQMPLTYLNEFSQYTNIQLSQSITPSTSNITGLS